MVSGFKEYYVHVILLTLLYCFFVLVLVLTYVFGDEDSSSKRGESMYRNYTGALVEAFCLLVILLSNALFAVREEYLKKNEISNRIDYIVKNFLGTETDGLDNQKLWSIIQFWIEPFSPRSDSIKLTLVYRDNRLINIPNNLLVEGDVILLSPG